MIYTTSYYLDKYVHELYLKDINLTKNYLFKKSKEKIKLNSNIELDVHEISINNEVIHDKQFSHVNKTINTKEEINNMKLGTKIHEVLEYLDFKNYDSSIIKDKFIRDKIDKFMNNKLLSNVNKANIYHEYEFIYKKDNNEYHGIIDLMLEYDDYIDIIDYKLKSISDEKYIDQLNGYRNYISTKSNKKINVYLYLIMDGIIKEI